MNYTIKIVVFLILAGIAVYFLNREDQRGSVYRVDDLGDNTSEAWETFQEDPALWITTFWRDWLIGNAYEQIDRPEVTLVRVDDPNKQHFEDWPPPRLDWAVILKSLEHFEPGTIGIVPPLQWDDSDTLAQGALKTRVLRLPTLIVGAVISPAAGDQDSSLDPAMFVTIENLEGDRTLVPEIGKVVAYPDEELMINADAAFSQVELHENINAGRNGIKIPLLARSDEAILPSFVLAVVMHHEGLKPADLKVNLDDPQPSIQAGDRYAIPIDAAGYLTVNGEIRELFPDLDAASLILSTSDFDIADDLRKAEQSDLDSLKTNAVVIGYDHADSRQFELRDGTRVSRAELLAMAIATIQSGRHITLWPPWIRFGAMGLLALVGMLLMRWGRFSSAVLGLFAGFVYIILNMLIFQSTLSWTPPLAPLGICLAIMLVGLFLPKAGHREGKDGKEHKKEESEPTKA